MSYLVHNPGRWIDLWKSGSLRRTPEGMSNKVDEMSGEVKRGKAGVEPSSISMHARVSWMQISKSQAKGTTGIASGCKKSSGFTFVFTL
jgi:hypothetical protein